MKSSQPERRPGTSQEPARKAVLILTAIIGLGAVVLVVVASKHRRHEGSANSSGENAQAPKLSGKSGVAPDLISTNFVRIRSRSATPASATRFEPDPSDVATPLVKSLSEVSLQPGGLTPEKAAEWHRNLEKLIEQGTAAVPALQEFFQRNQDVRFDSGPGVNLLEEPTLRIAFLKVLFDIPAPENVDLQEQVLRTTTDPDEIALLARQLELQEPGEYREVIIDAANAVLQKARNGKLPGRDTSVLVKILEQYGDTGVK